MERHLLSRNLSRREVMRAGAITAAGMALAPTIAVAADRSDLLAAITKPIPSTGERIPVIGLGTNQYSVNTPEEMAQLQEVLETMVEMGGSVVDTARVYGRAEEIIGELMARMGNRDRLFVATKTPIRGELRQRRGDAGLLPHRGCAGAGTR